MFVSTTELEEIENKILSWNSLDDIPPYTEIEILRILDRFQYSNLSLKVDTEALLYTHLLPFKTQCDG